MMKLCRKVAISCLVIGWFLVPASGQAACTTTLASLHGWYGMLVSGATLDATPAAKYLAGAVLFDGVGGLSAIHVLGGFNSDSSATGTYVLNSDCTLTIFLTVGATAVQTYTVAIKNPDEAVGIEVDALAVATIDLQPQYATYTPGLNFNGSSLNGTFVAACLGPLGGYSDLNLATFTNGTIAGTDPYNNYGSFIGANNPYTGTYTVNSDGTIAGNVMVDGAAFDFFGVISNGGTGVQYFYTNIAAGAPTDAFESCAGNQ